MILIVSYLDGMDEEYPFEDNNNMGFKKCRPVRRDEVTFYEGRESE